MEYQFKESPRARHLRITVRSDGSVILTKPLRISLARATAFLQSRTDWIRSVQKRLENRKQKDERLYGKFINLPRLRKGAAAYRVAVKDARNLVTERAQHFAHLGGFRYTAISIRNQKTRWGSCSARGALSFNYRLIYLTPEELDYLIVHELAHTKHQNHKKEFWDEVARFVPNWKELRKGLKRYRW